MITEASGVLARAGAGLGASVYYKQVTIVVPPAWTEADCRVKITTPDRGLAYQVRTVSFITKSMLQYLVPLLKYCMPPGFS